MKAQFTFFCNIITQHLISATKAWFDMSHHIWDGKLRSFSCPRIEESRYINDTVIYRDSWEEHLRTLKELLGRLRRARTTARPMKCLLGANRMEFLGHQIGGDVITPSSDNLEKVRCPLSDLLKNGKSEQVQWNEAQECAYSLLKEYLYKNQY